MAKEIKKLEKAAEELGYVVYRVAKNGHIMWQHVEMGSIITTAGTPSDHRSLKNALSLLRAGAEEPKGRR